MPAILWNALKSGTDLKGLTVQARAWYFPNRSNGLPTVPLVAEIDASASPAAKSMPPQIAAGVFDERQGKLIGTSTAVLTWKKERDSRSGTVYLKLVNPLPSAQHITIDLTGYSPGPDGTMTVLSGDLKTMNSIGEPTKISPVTTQIHGLGISFGQVCPADSVVVLTLRKSR